MSGVACDFNNIETRAFVKFFPLQVEAPKEIHSILTETLACFLLGRAKDLSAPLYFVLAWWKFYISSCEISSVEHVARARNCKTVSCNIPQYQHIAFVSACAVAK